ncbi:MAG: Gfo/Idh/MocA family oxidoreductase [Bacteroidales bacterium]|nr:Gfo/Idh/MocA family oxidoreductase [Bacteroidales bacterium]
MALKQIRWGIIGCGNVTETKSGPAFQQIEGSEIVAVMRRDADKAADYAKRHGIAKWYANADDLINDTEVNAIYIATPPDSHAEYTLKALKAGKPVYVEKPMALNYAEAKKMISASRKYQVPVFVAYYRRALSGFLKAKEWIDKHAIGEITNINLHLCLPARKEDYKAKNLPWRVQKEIAGGGYFFDLASHQLDWLSFVFGKADFVSSHVENRCGLYAAEDYVEANLRYRKKIDFRGKWDFCAKKEKATDSIEIIGRLGKITFSTFAFEALVLENKKGKKEFPFDKPKHVQKQLIEQVVKQLQGIDTCVSTVLSATETNRLMEKIIYG